MNRSDVPAHLHELLTRERGAFLLGTTAVDVQSITGQRREETHFYRLSDGRAGSPVSKMLECYPQLANPNGLSPAHAAFVTGYLVHLVWDELWAWDIFVPFYRDGTQWRSRRDFFVHHNALRVWLDRTAYAHLRDDPAVCAALRRTVPDRWLSFVSDASLSQWRDWLVEQLSDPSRVQTAEVFAERLQVPLPSLEHVVTEMAAGTYVTVPGIESALVAYEVAALTASVETVLHYWEIEPKVDRVPVAESARLVV